MIDKLMNPRTIAVIGASNNSEKVGFALMKNLQDFKGKVIPINPKMKYKTVLDYKGQIDLAVIAIPAKFVAKALEQCGKKKIKNVIVITAGFSEIGNIRGERQIENIAKKYKINLLGPNCFGIANPYLNLDTTFAKNKTKKGKIAFISQSGALWSYAADLGIGFSGYISLGNPIGINFAECLDYFCKDKKTKSIVLYIEKLGKGRKFLEIAKKCKKPIYAIKAGKSKEGSKAAISHTGSLATDYEIYKGAFKQSRVKLCSSLIQAFQKASKKQIKTKKIKLKPIKKAIIITNAGGAGVLAADYLSEKATQVNGPYDILGTAQSFDYKKSLDEHKKIQTLIIIVTPQTMTDTMEIAKIITEHKKQNKKQQIITCFLGKQSIQQSTNLLRKKKIPCFNTLEGLRKSL